MKGWKMPFINKSEVLDDGRFKPTHGHTSSRTGKTLVSPTYQTWNRMKDRVLNPNHEAYSRYGGRGIVICEKWLTFEGFLDDMGERPSGLTLERRDNNGNYNRENCYWATRKQQQRNRSTNLVLEFHGIKRTAIEWAERFYLPRHVVYDRVKKGWPTERVLLTEVTNCRFKRKGALNAICE